MDYETFKRKMGEKDPAYKFMSDSDIRAKHAEYSMNNQQIEENRMNEDRDKMYFEIALLAKTIRLILVLGIAITVLMFVGMIFSAVSY